MTRLELFETVSEAEANWRAAFERLKTAMASGDIAGHGIVEYEAWLNYRAALMRQLEALFP